MNDTQKTEEIDRLRHALIQHRVILLCFRNAINQYEREAENSFRVGSQLPNRDIDGCPSGILTLGELRRARAVLENNDWDILPIPMAAGRPDEA